MLTAAIVFRSYEGLLDGLLLGLLIVLTSYLLDLVLEVAILKREPIYDMRRIMTLSFVCWVLWFPFILVGAAVCGYVGVAWWTRLSLLGFSAVLILRLVVFKSSTSMNATQLLLSAFLQPFFCLLPFLWFWLKAGYVISFGTLLAFAFSSIVAFLSTCFFLYLLDQVGEQMLGVPSLFLFKAFLLNWVLGLNAPFEDFLERLSEEQDIEVSLIKLDSPKYKSAIVVSSVHPGPFKNVGSSLLPSLIESALQKEGYVACVPLGLQGHELDLTSQLQNQKVIDSIVDSIDFKTSETRATRCIKTSTGLATAYCQILGNAALLSLTLAPSTTEDLPQELGLFIRRESEKYGFTCCVAVNAHNSIDGVMQTPEALDDLKTVATACLDRIASLKRFPFEIGSATVKPEALGVKEGMGAGGITAIVVNVDGQKTAYVVIDGNNMISGLREKILSALRSMGINEGEVFTTDTHSVSAIVLSKRGYHPIGEVIDHETLIGYIKKAVLAAMSALESVSTSCRNITVPKVRVIGEKRLETLSLLTDRVIQRARRVAVPMFALSGLVLMMLLLIA